MRRNRGPRRDNGPRTPCRGADTSRAADGAVADPAAAPVFVLVRPQLGENVGAAARAMWNFGLRRMRLVDPRDGWPNPRAIAMASGAGSLLDEAAIHQTTAQAVADCAHVYATTARPREMVKPVLSPEAAVADMRARIAGGARVAVLFGPERTGLENEDVALANAIVTADTNPAFGSINLAQAARAPGHHGDLVVQIKDFERHVVLPQVKW